MLGNLIVLCPGSPKMFKFRFTSKAIWLLAISCLISFCAVLIIQYTLPRFVSQLDPARLREREPRTASGKPQYNDQGGADERQACSTGRAIEAHH